MDAHNRQRQIKRKQQKVSYKISTDYERVTYSVPDKFADLISWYLKATKKYSDNELHTLFIADTHYKSGIDVFPTTAVILPIIIFVLSEIFL